MENEKVLLDTDIGSDIDDAVAIAYLLLQPRCELMGITTVAGEPAKRAEMASAICRHAGRDDVPIHPGAPRSLLIPYRPYKGRAPQAEALGDWPRQQTFESASAVEFMRRTIRQHPGEITLLAIGPLTNVGLLMATDPEIMPLLKQLVLMGGAFFNVCQAEANIRNDTGAAAIVYGQGGHPPPPRHVTVGLDVTLQCSMEVTEFRRRLAVRVLDPVLDFAEVWFRDRKVSHFHDPLAAACIFEPTICTYHPTHVHVSLNEPTLGWTVARNPPTDQPAPHEVAKTIDPQRFFDHYFSVVK